MKTISRIFQILLLTAIPATAAAQSSIDALTLSDTELRGTSRFMSMAGAFTALGGDLSTLTQNPAGIGVYRGSDVALTLDLSFLSNKSNNIPGGATMNNTNFDANTIGYVGTMNFGSNSLMSTFSWGVSYNRLKSFTRNYRGSGIPLQTSMSNYIALMSDGIDPENMISKSGYDPYQDSQINWMNILAFNGAITTPTIVTDNAGKVTDIYYDGLFQYDVPAQDGKPAIPATTGTAGFNVRERGYADEYNIAFGGNLANVVQWGVDLGITDLTHEQWTSYDEALQGANIRAGNEYYDVIEEGDCDWQIDNWKKTTGTGFNLKFGLILKPVQELRIGVAVHTPTWYSMTTSYNANLTYGGSNRVQRDRGTNTAVYDWNLRTPWKLMFGLAGVIGGRGILSADYEYSAYDKMHTSDSYGDFDDYNDDIATYFRATNTLRLGAEFRVTPQFSLRLGYSYASSNVKSDAADNNLEIYTSGTNLGYTFNQSSNYVTAGLGYRTGGFYVDLAYVNRQRTSTYHCFTPFQDYDGLWTLAPQAKIKENANQLALTVGYKF